VLSQDLGVRELVAIGPRRRRQRGRDPASRRGPPEPALAPTLPRPCSPVNLPNVLTVVRILLVPGWSPPAHRDERRGTWSRR
jgi:hypothetical protein